MPFTNIENSGKGNNKGSCKALVNYLCKENEGKSAVDQEHFFSHSNDNINRAHVINSIDSNISKLGKTDSKFFMVTLNFSGNEIKHLGNDPKKIRAYSREVMESYARNFNKGLRSADLVWYAKIEYKRSYKGFEKEVLNGSVKAGQLKPGLNTHVHLVISRKDRTQKLKLSPMTNHRRSSSGVIKSGFDRVNFKVECERCFDQMFHYKREHGEFLIVANTLKNGTREQKTHVRQAIYQNKSPLLATLQVVKRATAHYPVEDEEERKKKGHDQGYYY